LSALRINRIRTLSRCRKSPLSTFFRTGFPLVKH
jgi:hypothetical protein